MLPNKRKCCKKSFFDFSLFWPFFGQNTAKIDQNEENCQNNCLIIFFEIWYVDASQQNKMLQKNYFSILAFFLPFLAKKQPKFNKNEEHWQNPNCLMKFPEIWYVDTSRQQKMLQTKLFSILTIFCLFLAKNSQN